MLMSIVIFKEFSRPAAAGERGVPHLSCAARPSGRLFSGRWVFSAPALQFNPLQWLRLHHHRPHLCQPLPARLHLHQLVLPVRHHPSQVHHLLPGPPGRPLRPLRHHPPRLRRRQVQLHQRRWGPRPRHLCRHLLPRPPFLQRLSTDLPSFRHLTERQSIQESETLSPSSRKYLKTLA